MTYATPPLQYSIWLLPAAPIEQLLAQRMAALAEALGSPRFWPHLTIQGDLALPLPALCAAVQTLAAQHAPQDWAPQAVVTGEHPFRCLYLEFAATPAFAAMTAGMAAASGSPAGLSPFPHLSLAYALDAAQRAAAAADWTADPINANGEPITFDRFAVVHCGSAIPIEDWRIERVFALGGAAG